MVNIATLVHHEFTPLFLYLRMLQLSRDYAGKRTAFKKPLTDHPLHMQTLARMEVSTITTNPCMHCGAATAC